MTDANHTRLSHAWLRSPELSSGEKGLLVYMVSFGTQPLTFDQLLLATPAPEEQNELPAWLDTLTAQGWVTAAVDGLTWAATPAATGDPR